MINQNSIHEKWHQQEKLFERNNKLYIFFGIICIKVKRVNFDFMSTCMWLFQSSMWFHLVLMPSNIQTSVVRQAHRHSSWIVLEANWEWRLEHCDPTFSNFLMMFCWWLHTNLCLVCQWSDALTPSLNPNWSANLSITFTTCWFGFGEIPDHT